MGRSECVNRSQELKDYLQSLNTGRSLGDLQLVCIRFAPNAPEQNPVEAESLRVRVSRRKTLQDRCLVALLTISKRVLPLM